MDTMASSQQTRYFEDFSPGDHWRTQARTITVVDGTLWAMFTGDMNPMHVDDELARSAGLFGGRFPPGLMSVAIGSGLQETLGLTVGTGLAVLEQTVRYRQPVLFGDTIHLELTVERVKRASRGDRGVVFFGYRIVKHDGTVCAEGETRMLVAARPVATSAAAG